MCVGMIDDDDGHKSEAGKMNGRDFPCSCLNPTMITRKKVTIILLSSHQRARRMQRNGTTDATSTSKASLVPCWCR